MAVETVVTNGTLVSSTGTTDADVAISDGKIVAVGDESNLPRAAETIDADGCLVMPGIVDPHVHFDGPNPRFDGPAETYETGSKAAALGGVTTVIDFAWQGTHRGDDEQPGTLRDGITFQKNTADESLIDYGLHATITREDPALFEELPTVVDGGVTSFKMFTAYDWGVSNGFMGRVFERLSDLGAVAILHTEDDSVCTEQATVLEQEQRGDPTDYPSSRPAYAEAMAADNALRMAVESDCKYYGLHTSCEKAAAVIERYRRKFGDGLVRGETCTHYTTLDRSLYSEIGTLAQLAPPLRSADDVESVFDHLVRGTLDVVSTDHVAYHRSAKRADDWWDSSYGVNSLQHSLPVFYDEAVKRRTCSPSFVVRTMSTQPARLFGLEGKGTLEPRTDADLVVFDPDSRDTISATDNASEADYSIYEGRTVGGEVIHTMVRGELVVRDGQLVGEPGHGEFVARTTPDWRR
ncbi:allantoinase [Natrarchaeobius halalkaliphilus]|uniref:Allantoinase n=1 Tax=Natrarchaeobius halalkaliphilus TaxID=1679091 RepID=A0A3N6LHX1_9EURY|nr:amidohydrolase family protein [Natrarchaeobius halalkaliphilus]RQG86649.1 allantoinase [Natrarchaeobius halalkaliphilus]